MGKDDEESKFQTASVTFLDGTVNEFKVHRGSRGEELFTLVSNGMSVEEKDHFALCFFDNQGMRHWIYNDKKIVRQLKGLPWVFSFQVKFFPISPTSLKDDTARHMLYLQCREDIKTGKLSASLPTRASLAALIAQSEFGDSSVSVDYDEYVRACTEGDELGEKLKILHAAHKGMNEVETEMAYLNECKDLSTYGVWQFPAKDSKGVEVMVGISAHGIVILREAVRLHRFPWQSIVKISYRRHYFSIRLKAGEVEKKESTLTYDCFTYEEAKRVWKCGVEHHTFFRLIQPELRTKGSLFHWGSSPFRFQGRTSFQNKMASQMFDQPTNVVRSPGSERQMRSLETENEVRARSNVQLNDHNLEETADKGGDYMMGEDGSNEKRKRKEEKSPKKEKAVSKAPKEKKSKAPKGTAAAPTDEVTGKEHVYYIAKVPKESEEDENAEARASDSHPSNEPPRSAGRPLFGWLRSSGRTKRGDDHGPAERAPSDEYYALAKERYAGPLDGLDRRDDLENLPLGIRVALPSTDKKKRRKGETDDASDDDAELTGAASPSRTQRTYYLARVRHDGDEEIVEREHIKPESYGVATTSYDGPLEDTPREDDLEHLPIRDHATVYHQGQSWRVDKEKSPKKEKAVSKAPKEKKSKAPKGTAAAPTDEVTGKEHVYYIAKVPKESEEDENAEARASDSHPSNEPPGSAGRPLFGWLRSSGRTKRGDDHGPAERAPSDEYYALAKERYAGPLDGLDRRDDLENLPLGIRVALPSTDKKKRRKGETDDASDDDAELTGAASPSRTQRTYYLARVRHDGDEEIVEREHIKPESYGVATTSYDGPLEDTPREDDLEHLPIRDHATVYHQGQSWRVDKEKSPKKEKAVSKAPKEKKSKAPKGTAAAPTDEVTGKEHVYYIAKVPKESEEDENAEARASDSHPSNEPPGSAGRPLFGWLRSSGRTKRGDDHGPAERAPSDEYYALAKERYAGPLDGLDRRDDLENLPLGIRVALPSTDKKKRRKGETDDASDDDAELTGAASPSRTQRTYYLARVRHDGDEEIVEREHIKPESYGVATTSYDGPLEDTPREDDLEHLPIRDHATVYHQGQSWRVDKEKSPKKEKAVSKAPKEKKSKAPKGTAAAPTDEVTGKEHVYYIAKVPKESEEDENAEARASDSHPSNEPPGSAGRPLFGWLRSSGRTKRGDDHGPAERAPSDEYYALAKERYAGPLDGLDRRDDLENLPLGIRVALPSTDKKKRRKGETDDASDDDAELTGAASPSRTQRTYYLARVRHDGDEEIVEREHIKPESYGVATTSYDGPLEDTPREDDLEHLPIRDHATVYHQGQSWRVDKEKSPKKEKAVSKAPKEKKSKAPKGTAAAPTDEVTGKEHVYYIAKVPKESEEDENAEARASDSHPSNEPPGSAGRPLFGWLRSSGRTKRGDDHGPAERAPSDEYYALAKERYAGPLDGLDRRDDLENLPLGIRVALPSTDKKKRRKGETDDASDDDAELTGAASPSRTQRTYYLARVRHDGDEEIVEREHIKPESYGVATTSYDGPLEDTPREDDLEHLPIRDHATVYHQGQSWRVDKEKSPKKEKAVSKAPKEKKSKAPKGTAAAPTDEVTGKEHVYYIAKVPKESEEDENAEARASDSHPSNEPPGSAGRPLFGWLRSSGRTKRGDDHGPAERAPSDEYYALAKERYAGPLDGLDRRDDLENLPLGIRVALPSTDKKKRRKGETDDASDDDAELTGAASPSRTQRTYYLARVRHDGDEEIVEREHIKPESYGVATTSYDGPLEDTRREDDLEHLPIRDHATVYHQGQSWRVDKEKSPKKEKAVSKAPKEKKSKAPKGTAAAPTDEVTGKEHVYYIAKVPKESEEDENAEARASDSHPSNEPPGSAGRPLFGWLRSSGRTKRGDDHGPAERAPSDEYYALAKERYAGPLDGLDRRDDLENLPLGIRVALPSTDKKKRRKGETDDASDDDAELTGAASPSRTQRTYYLARVRHDGDEEIVEREHIKPESYGVATTSYDGPLEDTPREDDLEHLPIRDHATVYHQGQSWRVDKEKSPKKEKAVSKAPKEKKSKAPKGTAAAPTDEVTGKEHVYYIAKVPKESEEDENAEARASDSHPSNEPPGSAGRPLFGWLRSSGRTKRGDDHGPAERAPSDEYYALAKERYAGPLDGLDRRDDLENLPLGIRVALPSTDKKKRRKGETDDASDDDAELTGAASPSRTQRTYYLARVRHDGDEEIVEREHIKPESYGVATTSYDGPLEDTPREDDLEHLPIRDHATVYHQGQSWRVDKEKSPKKEKAVSKAPKEKKSKAPKGTAAAPTDEVTGKEHVYYIAKVPKESEEDENAEARASDSHPSNEPPGSAGRPLFGWLRSSGRTKRGDDHGPAERAPSDEYYALAKERYAGPLDGLDRRDDLENLPLGIRVALPSTDKKKRRKGETDDASDDDAELTGAASPSRTQRTYYLARVRHDGDEEIVEREHIKPESYGVATTSYDGPLEDTPREDDLEHLPIRDHATVYHQGQSWRVDKEKSPKKEKAVSKAPKEKKSKAPKGTAAAPTDEVTGKEHVYYIAKVPKESEEDENAEARASDSHPSNEPPGSAGRPLFGWLRSSGRTKRGDDHGPAERAPSDEYYALAKERYAGPLDGLDRRDDLENLPLGIRVALPSTDKKKRRKGETDDASDDDAELTGAASPSRTQRTYYLARVRHDGDEEIVEREHIKPESYGVATTSYDGPLEDTPREDDLEHLPIRDHATVYHQGQSWRVDKEKSPKKEKAVSKAPKEKKSKAPKGTAAAPTDEVTGKEHVYYIAKVPKESEEDENAEARASDSHPSNEPPGSAGRPLFGWLRSSGRTKRGDDHGPAERAPSDEYYALAKERYAGPLDGLDRRDDLENLPLGIRVALPSTDKKKRRKGETDDASDDDAELTGAASPSRTQRTYYLARVRHDGDEEIVEREHIKPESYGVATTSYDGPLEDTPREDDLEHLPIRDHATVYHQGQSWRVDKEKSPKKEKAVSKAPKEKKSKAPKGTAAAPTDEVTGKEHVYYIAKVPKESEEDENAEARASDSHPSNEPPGSAGRPLFGWLRSSGRTKRGDDHGPAERAPSDEYYALAKERYAGPLDGLDRRDDLENLPLGIRVALPSTDKKKRRKGETDDASDDDAELTGAASPSRTQRTYYLARVRHDGDEEIVEREHIKPESYGVATTSYDGPLEDTRREDDLEHLPIRDHATVYHQGQSWRVDKEKSPKKEKAVSKAPKEKKSKAPKGTAAAPTDEVTGKEHVYYIAKVPKESEEDENAEARASDSHPSNEPPGSAGRPLFGWLRSSGRTKRGDDHGPAERAPSDEYYALAKERYAGPLDGLDRRDDLENLPLGIRVALPSTDKKKRRKGETDDASDDDAELTGAASPSRTQRTYYLARVRHDGDEEIVEREHIKPESYGVATTSYDGPLEDTPREDDLEHLPIRDHATVYHQGQSWRVDKEKSPKKEKAVSKAPKEKKSKAPKGTAAAPTDEVTGKEHVYYIAKVPKESEEDENAEARASDSHPSNEPPGSAGRPLFGWLRSSGRTKRGDDHGPAERAPSDEYYALAKERYAGPLDGLDRRDDLENLPLGIRVALPSTDKKKRRKGETDDASDDDAELTGAASPSRTQRTYYLARVRHDGDEEIVEREHIKPESYGVATTSYDGPLEDTPREDDLEHLPIRDHATVYHQGQSWRVDKEKSPKKEKAVSKAPKEKKSKAPKGTAAAPTDEVTGKEHVYYIAKVPKESEEDENAEARASDSHPSNEPPGSAGRPLFGWLRSSGRTKRGDDHGPAERAPSDEYYALAKERYAGPLDGLDRRDDLENLPLGIRVALPSTDKKKRRKGETDDASDDDAELTGAASPSRTQRTYYLARVRHDGDEEIVEREHIKPESYGVATTSYDGPLEDTPREDDLEHLPIRDHATVYHQGQSWRVDKEKSPKKEKAVSKAPKEKKSKAPKGTAAAPTDEVTGKEHVYYIAKVPKESEEDENAEARASDSHPSNEPPGSAGRPLFGWLRSSGRTKRGDDHGPAERAPSDEYYALAKERYAGPLDGLDRRDDLENLPLGIRVALPSTDKKKRRKGETDDASDDDAELTGAASPSRTQRTYYLARVRHDGDEEIVEREHIKPESYGVATTSYDGPLEDTPREDDLEHLPIRDHATVYHQGQSWRVDKEKSPKKEKAVSKAPKEKKSKAPKGTAAAPTDEVTGKEHVYYIAKVPKESEEDETGAASPSRTQRTYYLARVRHDGDEEIVEREHIKPESYGVATTSYDGPLEDTPREDDLEHLPIRDHATVYHQGQSWRVDKEKSPKKEKAVSKASKEKKSKAPKGTAAAPTDEVTGKEHVYYIAKVPKESEEDENAEARASDSHPSNEPPGSAGRPLFGWLRSSGRTKRGDDHGPAERAPSDEYYALAKERYAGPLDGLDRRDDLENLPLGIRVALPSTDKKKRRKGETDDASDDDAELTGAASPSRTQRTYYLARVRHDGDEEIVEREHIKPESYGVATTSYDGPLEDTRREDDLEHLPIRDHATVYHQGQSWRVDKEKSPKKEKAVSKAPKEKKSKAPKGTAAAPTDEVTGKEHVYYIAKVPKESEEDENAEARASDSHPSNEPPGSAGRPLFGWLRSSGRTKRGDDHGPAERAPSDEYYALAKERYAGPLDGLDRRDDLENLPLGIRVALPSTDKKKRRKGETDDASDDDAELTGAASPSRTQRTYYLARVRHDGDEEIVEREHIKPESYGVATTSYDGPLEDTPREDDLEHLPIRDHATVYHQGQSWRVDKEKSPKKEKAVSKAPKEKKSKAPKGTAAAPTDEVTGKEHVYYIAKVPKESEEDETGAASPSRTQRTYYLARVRHDGDEEIVEREHIKPESYGVATTSYDGPLEDTPREDDLEHLPIRDHATVYHQGQSWRVDKEKSPKKEKAVSKASKEKKSKAPKGTAAAPTDEVTGKEHVYYIAKVPKESEEDENAEARASDSHPSNEPPGSAGRPLFGWLRSSGRTKRGDDHGPAERAPSDEYYALAKERYAGPLDGLDRRDDLENLPLGIRVALPSTDKKKRRKGETDDASDDDAELTGAASPSRTQRTYYLARVRHDGDEEIVEREHIKPESYGVATTSYDGPLEDTPREDDLEHLPIRDHATVYHQGQSWRVDKEKSPKKEKAVSKAPKEKKSKAPKGTAAAPTDEVTGKEHVYYIAKVPKESEEDENAEARASDSHPSNEPPGSAGRPLFGWLRSSGRTKRGDDHGPAERAPSDEYYALAKERYAGPLDGLDRRDDLENLPLVAVMPRRILADVRNLERNYGRNVGNEGRNVFFLRGIERVAEVADGHEYTNGREIGHTLQLEPNPELAHLEMEREQIGAVHISRASFKMERRMEVELERVFVLGSSNNALPPFSFTPPFTHNRRHMEMTTTHTSSSSSFFSRIFARKGAKSGKSEGNEKRKKGRRSSSNESSDSSDDNEHEMRISNAPNQKVCTSHSFTRSTVGSLVREERHSHTYRLTGDGLLPQFTPDHSSLEMETTMARCEALNSSVPHIAHSEREISVRASAPLPRHYSEVGEPRCTVASWKESSEEPGEIEYERDADGNMIGVRSMVSHTKHCVHKHNYTTVQGMGQIHSESMSPSDGEMTGMIDNWTRSVEYSNEGMGKDMGSDDMGELVSSKCIQSGNGREIEILTYKRMGINGMEQHLEYRVTIHSDAPIDHDAELSAAILEATAVNPNYHVEKIEVRQESTH